MPPSLVDLGAFILDELCRAKGWMWQRELSLSALVFVIPTHDFRLHPWFKLTLRQLEAEQLIFRRLHGQPTLHGVKADRAVFINPCHPHFLNREERFKMSHLSQFLSPYARYRGPVQPENLVFDANLQEFAHRVSIVTALETGGKLTSEDAFKQIEALWEHLKASKHALGIGEHPFQA